MAIVTMKGQGKIKNKVINKVKKVVKKKQPKVVGFAVAKNKKLNKNYIHLKI